MTYVRLLGLGCIVFCFMIVGGCSCGTDTEADTTGPSGAGASGTGTTTSSTATGTAGGGAQGGSGGSGGSSSSGVVCNNDPDCDDGMQCNGVEVCVNGFCNPGTPLCDDGIPCTDDACDEATLACTHNPVNALCDDQLTCTGTEFCNPLMGCLSTGGLDCSDGIACTTDFCNLTTDACDHTASDALCSNGVACDGVETCDPVNGAPVTGCVAGTPTSCDDGIPCTSDSCDAAAGGCTHIPVNGACSDGVFCNGAELCDQNLGCVAGSPPNCDDGRSCTLDACSDAQGACTHTPVNAACSDGMFCNGVEICSPAGPTPTGCLAGSPIVCPPDGIACTTDTCDDASQSCVYAPNNGACPVGQVCSTSQGCIAPQACTTSADCQNGNLCDGAETCVGGFCQSGTAVNCNDNIACTIDSCNPATGQCTHAPNNAACDDTFACNGLETCSPATGCVSTQPVNCDDGIMCTVDFCQEPTGACVHFADDLACDDGVLCNGAEVCDTQLGCQVGQPTVCPDDGIACTLDECDPVTNACVHTAQSGMCPCGQTCSPQNGGCGFFCIVKECQGHVYSCGDCIDNDGDCLTDDADDQCLGPCDNTEDSYYGGIPGQNNSPCKSDCYFDQDTGSGNDDCYWSHKCDPLEVPPDYPPEGDKCSYNPGASIPGYGGSCSTAYAMQSQACLDYCGPLTPNGCDCFGCCSIPGAPTTVWLGSENPSGVGSCNLNTVNDPNLCKPCTQVPACLNTCEVCEICIGKPDLPPGCNGQECPAGTQQCGLPGQPPCPAGYTCITGCCQLNPQ